MTATQWGLPLELCRTQPVHGSLVYAPSRPRRPAGRWYSVKTCCPIVWGLSSCSQNLPMSRHIQVRGWSLSCFFSFLGLFGFSFFFFFFSVGVELFLQCCVNFCYTTIWISHLYTHILYNISPFTPHIPPLWVITEPWAERPVLQSSFPLAILFTHGSAYMSIFSPVSSHHPKSLPLSTRPFSPSALCPCPAQT